jgi:hypothetical protein
VNAPLDEPTLLAALRPYLIEAVPPEVLAAANEGLRWGDPDAALALLVADTVPAGVRGPGPGVFAFEVDDVTIEVEAGQFGDELRLAGQITPPSAARVRIDQPGGSTVVTADDLGRFAAGGLVPDAWRLAVLGVTGRPIHTEWIL